jgi:hypothetical protein
MARPSGRQLQIHRQGANLELLQQQAQLAPVQLGIRDHPQPAAGMAAGRGAQKRNKLTSLDRLMPKSQLLPGSNMQGHDRLPQGPLHDALGQQQQGEAEAGQAGGQRPVAEAAEQGWRQQL